MGRILFHSHRMALAGCPILILGGASTLQAQGSGKPLVGRYHFSATITCAVDRTGFDETNNQFAREEGGFTRTSTVQGTVTYRGNGTGTFTGQLLDVRNDLNAIGQFPISQVDQTCSVTNTVNPDGTFTETRQCTNMPTAGIAAGSGNTNTLSFSLQGVIDTNRKILHYHDTQTIEEVLEVFDSTGTPIFTRTLICTRFGSAIKQ